jgi:PAS domain S-box-containing protein
MARAPSGSGRAVEDANLSVDLLQRMYPEVLSTWVSVGIYAALVGYGASSLGVYLEHSAPVLLRRLDPWLVVCSALALVLHRRGRTRVAGLIVLGAVWLEQHVTLATMPQQVWASPAAVLPLLVLLAGLWLGARAARWLGAATVVSVPLTVVASGVLGIGPGLSGLETAPLLVGMTLAIGVTLLLLSLVLQMLGRVLRASEEDKQRLRELIDDTPDAILALDAEQCVEQANPAAARLLGLALEDLLGKPVHALSIVPTGKRWDDALTELREGDAPLELSTADGEVLVEAIAQRRTRTDGSHGTLLVLRDVTARAVAERQARALQAQLQQAQKMEAVGILAGSVAHDFNNLLTAVGGYGSLLQRSSDPTARAYAVELTSVQERGASLVKQILTFARRDAVQPRPIDLAELLSSLTPLMQRLVGEQVRLSLDVGETCPVVVDPGQIEQVMLNLVANARDAMRDGGTVHVRCWRDGMQVMLSVRDTGEGMSEAVRARAFDAFFTTKEPGKGTGLGLSTAASIVREAGGTIAIESELGAGTCFTITLPATDLLPQAIARRAARASEHVGKGRHIVVAEDNDSVRSYLKLMLERAGFRVTMVRSGDEASAAITAMSTSPDLLLTDMVMPGRTGPQVAADARVRFPDLPVLFMSGYAGEAGKRADFAAEDLVRKPFTDHELLERIEDKLSGRSRVAAAG